MPTQDPFARRPKKNMDNSLGEVSSINNTLEEDNVKIAPYVPSTAEVDEGFAKMMAILHQQSIDDAREGTVPDHAVRTVLNPTNPAVTTAPNPVKPAVTTASISKNEIAQPILTEVPKSDTEQPVEEEKPPIKDEDVLPILDSILLRGYASESFTIRGNKITLRTQFYWEEYAVRAAVESKLADNALRLTADTLLQKYVLASCLEAFGNNYFKPLSQGSPMELRESLDERVAFLDTLPTILVFYLNDKRVEFNDKILYLSENFDRLLKTF